MGVGVRPPSGRPRPSSGGGGGGNGSGGSGGGSGGGVRLTDLNDFLRPASECVLPLPALLPPGSVAAPMAPVRLPSAPTDGLAAPTVAAAAADVQLAPAAVAAAPPIPVARVSLSDCLVCSGCVSSADATLLGGAGDTATARLLTAVADPATRVLVLLSAASLASIAAAVATAAVTDTATATAAGAPAPSSLDDIPGRVAAALRSRGVDAVGHGGAAREVAAAAAAADFLRRRASGDMSPLVASECPAVVLLATKRYGARVTAALGRGRSIQAAGAGLARAGVGPLGDAATVARGGDAGGDGRGDNGGEHLFVAAVAPCADKKLEAAMPQFGTPAADGTSAVDTDVVLTTVELVALLTSPTAGGDPDAAAAAAAAATTTNGAAPPPPEASAAELAAALAAHAPAPLDTPPPPDHVLRVAAAALLDVHLPPDHTFTFTLAGRSTRGGSTYFRETSVTAPDGRSLRFAYAYGYRHVQNVARRLSRPDAAAYDYVELLACGGGVALDVVRAAYRGEGTPAVATAASAAPPPPLLPPPPPSPSPPLTVGSVSASKVQQVGGKDTTTVTAAADDVGEAAITLAATAGLTPDGVATYSRAAQDVPHLLRAAYTPLERERDAMFVTPAALSSLQRRAPAAIDGQRGEDPLEVGAAIVTPAK
ncbi:hypothetical protein MMPV_007003 [Pyropia vietnamensis]